MVTTGVSPPPMHQPNLQGVRRLHTFRSLSMSRSAALMTAFSLSISAICSSTAACFFLNTIACLQDATTLSFTTELKTHNLLIRGVCTGCHLHWCTCCCATIPDMVHALHGLHVTHIDMMCDNTHKHGGFRRGVRGPRSILGEGTHTY